MNLNEFIVKYPSVDIDDLMSTILYTSKVIKEVEEARQEINDRDALEDLRRKMDSSPDDDYLYDNDYQPTKLHEVVIKVTIERT